MNKPWTQDQLISLLKLLLDRGLQQSIILKTMGTDYPEEMKPIADKARQMYMMDSDGCIGIDTSPLFSDGDDGTWVSAWVWVPKDVV